MKCNILNKIITLCGLAFALNANADGLYINNFGTVADQSATVSLLMQNTNAVSGFQFDLTLPQGITLEAATASSARTSYAYTITQKTQTDGSIRIVCMAPSAAAAVFTGNDGEVMTLRFASTRTTTGTITLKNQILTEATLVDRETTATSCEVHRHNLSNIGYAATCTATGLKDCWECSVCSKIYTNTNATTETTREEMTIPALNHNYGDVQWTWADNGKSASAKIVCANDASHVVSANATITSAVKTPATCTTMGVTTYTAKVTLNGQQYSSTKDVTDIAILNHNLEATYNGDCTHTLTCSRGDYTTTEDCIYQNGVCTKCGSKQPIPGDVNLDNKVTISDIVGIINFITGGNTQGLNRRVADANGSGSVTLDDVTTVANLIKK